MRPKAPCLLPRRPSVGWPISVFTCRSPINAWGRAYRSIRQNSTFALLLLWPKTMTVRGKRALSARESNTAFSMTSGASLESSGSRESKSLQSPRSGNWRGSLPLLSSSLYPNIGSGRSPAASTPTPEAKPSLATQPSDWGAASNLIARARHVYSSAHPIPSARRFPSVMPPPPARVPK